MRELGSALDVLCASADGYVVVEMAGSPYYVQVLRTGGGHGARALVEAVSNADLDDRHALTASQEALLERLGWARPGRRCHPSHGCALDHRHWYRHQSIDADPGVRRPLLATVLATLVVYGAHEGTRCTVSSATSDGATVALP